MEQKCTLDVLLSQLGSVWNKCERQHEREKKREESKGEVKKRERREGEETESENEGLNEGVSVRKKIYGEKEEKINVI